VLKISDSENVYLYILFCERSHLDIAAEGGTTYYLIVIPYIGKFLRNKRFAWKDFME